jgi:hypothetical protein
MRTGPLQLRRHRADPRAIPRTAARHDRIATDALELGVRRKIKIIDRELVARVLGDSDLFSDD